MSAFEYDLIGNRVLVKLQRISKTIELPDGTKQPEGFNVDCEVVAIGRGCVGCPAKVGDILLLVPGALNAVPIFRREEDYYAGLNIVQIFAIKKPVTPVAENNDDEANVIQLFSPAGVGKGEVSNEQNSGVNNDGK